MVKKRSKRTSKVFTETTWDYSAEDIEKLLKETHPEGNVEVRFDVSSGGLFRGALVTQVIVDIAEEEY